MRRWQLARLRRSRRPSGRPRRPKPAMPDMGDYSTRTWPPLNDARVLLMLEAVAKDLVKIVDSQILAGFNRYRSAYFFDRAHPGTDARKELSVEYEKLEKAIEKLRAEALRVFQE